MVWLQYEIQFDIIRATSRPKAEKLMAIAELHINTIKAVNKIIANY